MQVLCALTRVPVPKFLPAGRPSVAYNTWGTHLVGRRADRRLSFAALGANSPTARKVWRRCVCWGRCGACAVPVSSAVGGLRGGRLLLLFLYVSTADWEWPD